jgi:hypothetical protein
MELTKLENAVLMMLEEAGEENLAALLNSVKDLGALHSTNEIDEFRMVLIHFVENSFLEIARSRDEASKRWIPLPRRESISLLRKLDSLLRWSNTEKLWTWSSSSPRLAALLTNAGTTAARETLSKRGWPGAG